MLAAPQRCRSGQHAARKRMGPCRIQKRVMRSACTATVTGSASSDCDRIAAPLQTALCRDAMPACSCIAMTLSSTRPLPAAKADNTNHPDARDCGLRPANMRGGPHQRIVDLHLDERVGLGQVISARGLVVEVARVRLRQPVAAAEDVAAAALEARQPDLWTHKQQFDRPSQQRRGPDGMSKETAFHAAVLTSKPLRHGKRRRRLL